MQSSVIKPGEIRILKALEDDSFTDKELIEKASLVSPNVRIRYLRNLQESGLINRDIYSRKYSISDQGREMLRLVDRMIRLLAREE